MALRNRHWKQRFSEGAQYVWNKSVLWMGEQVATGSLIPDDLRSNRNRLRRFWESGVIALADFVAPDVTTGQVPQPVADEPEAKNWRDLPYQDQVALARENGLEGRLPSKNDLIAFLEEKVG